MSDSTLSAILGTFIVQVFGFAALVFKSWYDNRKNIKNSETREKQTRLKIEESINQGVKNESELVEIKSMLKEHISENDFPYDFKSEILTSVNNKINSYHNLHKSHISALNLWSKLMSDLGMDYWKIPYRKKKEKQKLEKFLTDRMNVAISDLDRFLEKNITVPKEYKSSKIYFNTFIGSDNKEYAVLPIHNLSMLFISKLAENGFTHETMIQAFVNYLESFIDRYFQKLDLWISNDLTKRYDDDLL